MYDDDNIYIEKQLKTTTNPMLDTRTDAKPQKNTNKIVNPKNDIKTRKLSVMYKPSTNVLSKTKKVRKTKKRKMKGGGSPNTNDDEDDKYDNEKDIMTILCTASKYGVNGLTGSYASIFIFAFTTVYVIAPMIIMKDYNYHIMFLLTLYAIIDIFVRIKCKCIPNMSSLFTNILFGGGTSLLFIYIVLKLGLEHKILYTEILGTKTNLKSSNKMPFRCSVYKGGEIIDTTDILAS
jgi:hypothetical protein